MYKINCASNWLFIRIIQRCTVNRIKKTEFFLRSLQSLSRYRNYTSSMEPYSWSPRSSELPIFWTKLIYLHPNTISLVRSLLILYPLERLRFLSASFFSCIRIKSSMQLSLLLRATFDTHLYVFLMTQIKPDKG